MAGLNPVPCSAGAPVLFKSPQPCILDMCHCNDLLLLIHCRYQLHGQTYTAGSRGALLLVSTNSSDSSSTGSEHGDDDLTASQAAQLTANGDRYRGQHPGQQQVMPSRRQQQQQEQQYECLSSVVPLHRTSAPGNQQDQDAV